MEDEETPGEAAWAHRDNPSWTRRVLAPPQAEPPWPDPMDFPDWPLATALAWVMTRHPSFIRSLPPDRIDRLLSLDVHAAHRKVSGDAVLSRREAEALLWRELSAGTLTGSAADGALRRELRPVDWQDWHVGEGSGRLGPKGDAVLTHNRSSSELLDPSFRRDDVIRCWPPIVLRADPEGGSDVEERTGPLPADIPQTAKRQRGAPSYRESDARFMPEMRRYVEDEGRSRNFAVQIIWADHGPKVEGSGGDESKRKRLLRRYEEDRRERGLNPMGEK